MSPLAPERAGFTWGVKRGFGARRRPVGFTWSVNGAQIARRQAVELTWSVKPAPSGTGSGHCLTLGVNSARWPR